jgi:hypothetical protein
VLITCFLKINQGSLKSNQIIVVRINHSFLLAKIGIIHLITTESNSSYEKQILHLPLSFIDNFSVSEIKKDVFLEERTEIYVVWFDIEMDYVKVMKY